MNHLKENGTTYWKHWRHAMSMSLALFIHAWFPNILTDYASKKMEESKRKIGGPAIGERVSEYFR
jgi:hypothetical protein